MKRNVFCLFALMTFGLAASAQTEKGSWLVGGNLNLNTASDDFAIGLNPSAGYFFLNNFAAGATAEISYSKIVDEKTTRFGVGPFARYYFGTMNIRPFGHGEVTFVSNKDKDNNSSNTYNSTSFFVGGGLAAFINRNVAIEGLAGYRRTSYEGGNGTGGFNLRIGFQVYLSGAQVDNLKKGNL
ncbi:MAG: outer membrane beta-barrel protein [Chitinophagaceae bacterium]